MNLTLGGGDEENSRPLLGGLGSPPDTSGGRIGIGGTGLGTFIVERIARAASIILGGSSGGGSGCPWVGAMLPSGKACGEAIQGDALFALSEDGCGWVDHAVKTVGQSMQPCAKLVTQSGIELTTSLSTPLTTMDEIGALVTTEIAVGVFVPVLDDAGFRWEPIETIEPRGDLPVRLIDCAGGTFAAGDHFGRYIFTHNKAPVDPDAGG